MTTVLTAHDTEQARADRRADRWDALGTLWKISSQTRVRGCRRVGVLADGAVAVRVTGTGAEKRAGFAGLATCGSVWACPCCAERIQAGRQTDMAAALEAWTATGGRVVMVTLTMRHRDGEKLADLWDSLSYAWGKVTSGRAWERTQVEHGVPTTRTITRGVRRGQVVTENRLGWIKVVEATNGANGWHVHIHAALLVPADVTATDADNLGCMMFARWRDALIRRGHEAPLARSGGLDASLWTAGTSSRLGEYFTKNTYQRGYRGAGSAGQAAAAELARGDFKIGRRGNRTPFQILADITEGFLADDGDLWAEWEAASHGRRQMAWSTGLRDRLLPDVAELSDDELAAQTVEGEAVVVLTRAGVNRMSRDRRACVILEAAEALDVRGLVAVLNDLRIGWKVPDAAWCGDSRNKRAA